MDGTREMRITYGTSTESLFQPIVFCDSDWAGCKLDRKSTSGFIFIIAGGAVSWKSKKQSVVKTSTVEAEYMAMGAAAQECVRLAWIFQFANSLKDPCRILINVDNLGSVKMAKKDASGNRTKHIDIKYHLLRYMLR